MLGVFGARGLRVSFADETHGALETVLRPDDPVLRVATVRLLRLSGLAAS